MLSPVIYYSNDAGQDPVLRILAGRGRAVKSSIRATRRILRREERAAPDIALPVGDALLVRRSLSKNDRPLGRPVKSLAYFESTTHSAVRSPVHGLSKTAWCPRRRCGTRTSARPGLECRHFSSSWHATAIFLDKRTCPRYDARGSIARYFGPLPGDAATCYDRGPSPRAMLCLDGIGQASTDGSGSGILAGKCPLMEVDPHAPPLYCLPPDRGRSRGDREPGAGQWIPESGSGGIRPARLADPGTREASPSFPQGRG